MQQLTSNESRKSTHRDSLTKLKMQF